MKKLNNRGFLLVETVIVSVFVLTMFVLIYQNSIPMIEIYNQRIQYDDLNSVYVADLFRKFIVKDANYQGFLEEVQSVGYKDVGNCSIYSAGRQEVCVELKKALGILEDDEIYISDWNITELDKLDTLPRGYIEYIRYLKEQIQVKPIEYRLILSRQIQYPVYHYDSEVTIENRDESRYANIGM